MSEDDQDARIAQLQQQQSLMTQALAAALEGRWQGAGSVEAFLYALDPTLQGQLEPDPPVLSS
jgi:shikimate kinase